MAARSRSASAQTMVAAMLPSSSATGRRPRLWRISFPTGVLPIAMTLLAVSFAFSGTELIGIAAGALQGYYGGWVDLLGQRLLTLCDALTAETPTFSPRYIAHMKADLSLPGLLGWFAAMLHNPNNSSRDASQVGSVIETEAIAALAGMLGYDPAQAQGHFTSGGTVANFEAVWRARYRLDHWLSLGLYVAETTGEPLDVFPINDPLVDLYGTVVQKRDRQSFAILDKFAAVVRATVRGNVIIAVIQGTIGGISFWALGIEAALLWGVVMTFLSMLPAVGAAIVWIPAAIWLFLVGAWIKGVIMVVIGALVIGLVDNLLRPILVGKDTRLPDYLVMISTLGGMSVFRGAALLFASIGHAVRAQVGQGIQHASTKRMVSNTKSR